MAREIGRTTYYRLTLRELLKGSGISLGRNDRVTVGVADAPADNKDIDTRYVTIAVAAGERCEIWPSWTGVLGGL